MNAKELALIKCKIFCSKTSHTVHGFLYSNRRYTCTKCGRETGDTRNE